MAEIPALYSQRPIILRHQKAALYHPFIEALAMTLVDIPISFTISIIFAIIIYFIVGLQQSAQQFLFVFCFGVAGCLMTYRFFLTSIFYLFLFTMTLTMKAWFRAIAAAFESEATAQSVAGLAVLALVCTDFISLELFVNGALSAGYIYRLHHSKTVHDRSTQVDHLLECMFPSCLSSCSLSYLSFFSRSDMALKPY